MKRVARTASEFQAAWAALAPGDELRVVDVPFTGEFTLAHKHLTAPAEVTWDGCTFAGVGSAQDYPSVWLNDLLNVHFEGGSVSGPLSGTGILGYDLDGVYWHGYKVANVGGHGVALMGITKAVNNVDFDGDVSGWGKNLQWDPHATKGTGLHGYLIADSNYGIRGSKIRGHIHNAACGSGAEIGGSKSTDGVWNCDIFVAVHDLALPPNYPASGGQTCANGLQIWGDNVLNSQLAVSAWGLAGQPVHTGMWSGQSLATDQITVIPA